MARIAINGFGRIGRNVLRAAIKRGARLDVVHINDIDKPKTLAHLFKYDSVHGIFEGTVESTEDAIVVDGKKIAVTAKRDPSELPHKQHGCELVLECSGRFTDRASAEKHIAAGAKKVIISAPAKGQDFTVAFGINHEKYDPAKHNIVSNASCTTNCLAPVAKVLMDSFGIDRGFMFRAMCANPHVEGYACANDGQVNGFGLSRLGRIGSYIGPVIACSPRIAAGIVSKLLERFAPATERPVFIDVPRGSSLEPWLKSEGFEVVRG